MFRRKKSSVVGKQRRPHSRPMFESLEQRQLLAADTYFFATGGGEVVNSDGSRLRVTNHDIIELTVQDNGDFEHNIFFNGDSVGLENPASNHEAITAFAIDNDGGLLIVPRVRARIGGIQTDPGDILKFRSTRLGERTAGTWSRYFDASDVGFPSLGGSQSPFSIDALDVLDDGRLVMSLGGNPPRVGNVNLGGLSVNNKDLLSFQFAANSTATNTRGTWSIYSTDDRLGLTRTLGPTDENMDALWVDEDVSGQPHLLFSTADEFSIEHGGGAGEENDIGVLSRSGANANYRLRRREIVGDNVGLGNDNIQAFHKARPEIVISDATIVEGDAGTKSMNFRVRLTEPTSKTVGVTYLTQNDTALAGLDYTQRSGRVTWGPGQVGTRTISVPIRGDLVEENDERFRVFLANATNATIVDAIGVGTITDNDSDSPGPPTGGRPSLRISDVRALEGTSTGTNFVFTVTPSAVSSTPMSVSYTTVDGTATVADRDYTRRSGTLQWPANAVSSRRVYVWVPADSKAEADETFSVRLSNAVNASIADGVGIGTIVDDDSGSNPPPPPPTSGTRLSISDVRQVEGTGTGSNFVFTVTPSAVSSSPISVNYTTVDGTATAADRDYSRRSGTLQWPANAVSPRRVFVWVPADSKAEPDESFFVRLSNPVNASLADAEGIGTILNDDGGSVPPPPPSSGPSLRISDVTQVEGTGGGKNFVFTVTPSAAASAEMSVQFATVDGTAKLSDRDYVRTTGTLRWPAGSTAPRRIFVWVPGDSKAEPNETFQVRLSNARNASISDGTGRATILNDDAIQAIAAAMDVDDETSDALARDWMQQRGRMKQVDATF